MNPLQCTNRRGGIGSLPPVDFGRGEERFGGNGEAMTTRARSVVPGAALRKGAALTGLLSSACSFESTEAANVIVDIDFSLTGGSGSPVFDGVDLDGNGQDDILFVLGTASTTDPNGYDGIINGFGLGGAAIAVTSAGAPIAFQASDLVGSSQSFTSAILTLAFSSGGALGGRGAWVGGEDAYLGVRFTLGGLLRYGWIHLVWDPATELLEADRFGYQDDGSVAVVPPAPEVFPPEFGVFYGPATDADAGRVEAIWPVLAGRTYVLERSLDLETWEQIYVATAPADGEMNFLDDAYENDPQPEQFYRVGQQSPMSLVFLALGMGRRRVGRTAERSAWIGHR